MSKSVPMETVSWLLLPGQAGTCWSLDCSLAWQLVSVARRAFLFRQRQDWETVTGRHRELLAKVSEEGKSWPLRTFTFFFISQMEITTLCCPTEMGQSLDTLKFTRMKGAASESWEIAPELATAHGTLGGFGF